MSSVNPRTNYPSSRYYDGNNGKHFGPGTECPPLADGKVRIYNMRFCPYAQRAILVAEAKSVPYDVVNINLITKPEWIFGKNPMGKVPTLELPSGDVLYESLIVADYLDDAYPGRKLNSSDPLRRAQDRILIENFGTVTSIGSFYKLSISRPHTDEQSALLQEIRKGLAPFERELTQRGTKFFGGADAPGMVDYMIWPWVERMSLFKVAFPDLSDYQNDKKENPKLEQWRQAMKEDPAVKSYYLTPEQHFHFAASYLQGEMPDYDCLEELNSKI